MNYHIKSGSEFAILYKQDNRICFVGTLGLFRTDRGHPLTPFFVSIRDYHYYIEFTERKKSLLLLITGVLI